MFKKLPSLLLITIVPFIAVITTAVVAASLLFNQANPTLEDVPFIPASDAITEPVVEPIAEVETNPEVESEPQEVANIEVGDTKQEVPSELNTNTNTENLTPKTPVVTVTLSGPGIAKRCEVEVIEVVNVHQLMKQASKQCGFTYVGKQFAGLGLFVDELAGKLSDTKSGKYWIYYVNGIKASVGVSSQTVKAGDTVAWQFENELSN